MYNAIFFQYRDNILYKGWDRFCKDKQNNNPKMIHWTKPSVISYFREYYKSEEFLMFNQVPSGFIIVKKTKNLLNIISEWYKLSLLKPDLFIDPFGKELIDLPDSFNEHRHDQTVLALLIWKYQKADNIILLPETLESGGINSPCVVATRIHTYKWPIKEHMRFWYDRIFQKDK